jgi:hypothetical protein
MEICSHAWTSFAYRVAEQGGRKRRSGPDAVVSLCDKDRKRGGTVFRLGKAMI